MVLTPALALVQALTDTTCAASGKTPANVPRVRFTSDAGFVSNTGNTSVQTLSVGDKISARVDALTFTQQFSLVHGGSKGATIAASWRRTLRSVVTNPQDAGFLGGRPAIAYRHQIGPRASIAQSIELLPNLRESADLRSIPRPRSSRRSRTTPPSSCHT
ncbi:MAG: hypothetical protein ACRELE_04875 [Gemmatimonadales bacterium]